jgi:pyruvate-formate lyase-activating enzyme
MDVKHAFDGYDSLTGKNIDVSQYKKSIELIKSQAPDYEFRTTLIK